MIKNKGLQHLIPVPFHWPLAAAVDTFPDDDGDSRHSKAP